MTSPTEEHKALIEELVDASRDYKDTFEQPAARERFYKAEQAMLKALAAAALKEQGK